MARGKAAAPDPTTLEMALVGYQLERQRIDEKIKEIEMRLGRRRGTLAPGAKKVGAPKKRVLSAAARRRIAAAQRKRWAEHRKRMAAKNEARG